MVFYKAYPEGECGFTPWVKISAEEAFKIQNELEQKYGRDHTAQFYYTKDAAKAAWPDEHTQKLIDEMTHEYEFLMFDYVDENKLKPGVHEPYLMVFHGRGLL